jgi:hypothetical protein
VGRAGWRRDERRHPAAARAAPQGAARAWPSRVVPRVTSRPYALRLRDDKSPAGTRRTPGDVRQPIGLSGGRGTGKRPGFCSPAGAALGGAYLFVERSPARSGRVRAGRAPAGAAAGRGSQWRSGARGRSDEEGSWQTVIDR